MEQIYPDYNFQLTLKSNVSFLQQSEKAKMQSNSKMHSNSCSHVSSTININVDLVTRNILHKSMAIQWHVKHVRNALSIYVIKWTRTKLLLQAPYNRRVFFFFFSQLFISTSFLRPRQASSKAMHCQYFH